MANFEELARIAREKSNGIVAAADHARKVKEEAEANRLENAERVLHEHVVPILNQAKEAFAADGIKVNIEEAESFKIEPGRLGNSIKIRIVTFHCFSRLEGHPSGMQSVMGDKYVFEHDGTTITTKRYGASISDKTFQGGTFPDFVAPIVMEALDSYYEQKRIRG